MKGDAMIFNVIVAAVLMGATAVAGAAPTVDAPGPTLSSSKGTVMVNTGSRFVTAKPGQTLKAGDRVMVMQGGTATLTYADGSKAAIQSGTLFSVNSMAPGAQSALPAKKIGRMYAQAVGDKDDRDKCRDKDGNLYRDEDGNPKACGAVEAPEDNSYAIAAGAVGVVLIAAAIAGSGGGGHHDEPISLP